MNERIDLLIIDPSSKKKRVYQDISKDYSAIMPPRWAALTAGFIRKNRFRVKIIDSNAENLDEEEPAMTVKVWRKGNESHK